MGSVSPTRKYELGRRKPDAPAGPGQWSPCPTEARRLLERNIVRIIVRVGRGHIIPGRGRPLIAALAKHLHFAGNNLGGIAVQAGVIGPLARANLALDVELR